MWVEIQARETLHMAEIAKGEWEQRGREGKEGRRKEKGETRTK